MPSKRKLDREVSESKDFIPLDDELALSESLCAYPSRFEEIFEILKFLRTGTSAPVDKWGCHTLGDKDQGREVYLFQTIVAALLSSRTRDFCVFSAMSALKSRLPGGLTPQSVACSELSVLEECLKPVGFYATKAKNLQAIAKQVTEQGRCPSSMEELMELPGLGVKMSAMVMSVAFGRPDALTVDTHVHRICSKELGWVSCKRCKGAGCANPDHTRQLLELFLPKEKYYDFTVTLVGVGQLSQMKQEERSIVAIKALEYHEPDKALRLLERLGFRLGKCLDYQQYLANRTSRDA